MRTLDYKEFLNSAYLCYKTDSKKFYTLHKRALGIQNNPSMEITRYRINE